jgi:hypothetical protein
VKVEVLYVTDCPSHPAAVQLVRDVLLSEDVIAEISEVLIADNHMAKALSFRGSPTIRINGRDVAEESFESKDCAVSCRLYSGSNQIGLPPVEWIRRAVVNAREAGTR